MNSQLNPLDWAWISTYTIQMTRKEITRLNEVRNSKILEYRQDHTQAETAIKFRLSISQVCRVERKSKSA